MEIYGDNGISKNYRTDITEYISCIIGDVKLDANGSPSSHLKDYKFINLNFLLSISWIRFTQAKNLKDDPHVLSSQVKQVFYVSDGRDGS